MTIEKIMGAIHAMLPDGGRILWHAGQSECTPLRDRIIASAREKLTFAGLFIPGINTTDFTAGSPSARMESVFAGPAHREARARGQFDFLPMHYSQYPSFLESHPADLAILHLPPPRAGLFSCGPTADIADRMQPYARRVLVITNKNLPYTHGATALAVEDADHIFELDSPLAMYPSEPDDTVTAAIAQHVASLVHDGDTLQIGIGRVMGSILRALIHHRKLRLFSGMLIDEVADLATHQALIAGSRDAPAVTAGIAIGSQRLMDFVQREDVAFYGNRVTHNPLRIAAQQRFTAINSAIEIDLFGQMNCETLNGRQISGIGGGGDFLRAARLAPDGRAIIAMPAQSRSHSRIVAQITTSPVSSARADIDIVVTEFGVAHLRNTTMDRRAEALIAIAAPAHRSDLTAAWKEMRARLT